VSGAGARGTQEDRGAPEDRGEPALAPGVGERRRPVVTLVEVDGSQASRKALQYAMRSQAPDSELLLVYVSRSGRQGELETGRFFLEDGRRACEVMAGDVQIRTRLEVGDPAETIPAVAEAENADLIIIGSHGVDGFPHVEAIGQTARRLATNPKRRVVVISPTGSEMYAGKMNVATGLEDAGENAE
jgi:nucleotide-binding universal stress UspA family protein